MTTELLHSFRKPYFDPDVLSLEASTVTLGKRGRAFTLTGESAEEARQIYEFLAGLRAPEGPSWPLVRAGADDSGAALALVRSFDEAGWFSEDSTGFEADYTRAREELRSIHARCCAWLGAWQEEEPARARGVLSELRKLTAGAVARVQSAELALLPEHAADPTDFAWGRSTDFFQRILRYQIRTWERGSPLALATLVLVLAERLGAPSSELERAAEAWSEECLNERAHEPYSSLDLQSHLCAALYFAARVGTTSAVRRCAPAPEPEARRTGLNLMLHAEHLARDWQESLGASRFDSRLEAGASTELARGTYVEQFHLTRRFVEFLGPMFVQRLQEPLRGYLFKHFEEEFGHEHFELASCRALGLDGDAVTRSIPLPYSVAYIDLFTHIGEIDPMGWLVSILVTEGLPGSHTPVNESFAQQGLLNQADSGTVAQHEAVNKTLEHTLLPRHFLAQVGSLSVARQRRALDHLSFLLEFNFRLLESIEAFYSQSTPGELHGFLSVRHDELATRLAL